MVATTRKPAKFTEVNADPKTKVEGTKDDGKLVVTKTSGPAPAIKKCACGCGGNVPSKSNYKMGHDAKHAGVVGREAGAAKVAGDKDWKKILNVLPTSPLQTKALNIAINAAERLTKKVEAEAKKAEAKEDKKATVVKSATKK